ncbi:sugar ABC transporter substrate-binding protein [Oscillatoria sp. FACHB-1406]|uniref:ABC transporter substrate-binding protein n=1 Tax=Oscillatoria sp. FACHB-1406 TaxID=2692846 RepID=UPI0016849B51|nr:sugar ABC transporter substrate-binding protein [Oscillatoria sp. FACHB-1406]MBD2577582.1 sugar ABC transporter substrate-binding protein [Oscillatoria sp. FACHB-1406]
MRKLVRLCLFALVGLFVSLTISCNSGSAPSASGELEFWTMQLQPKFTSYFNPLIGEFEAQNPGTKIRWTDVPWEAMESKILSAVGAKTAPDVVNLNPNFASQLATRNAWLPLEGKVSPEQQQEYLPKIWQASVLDGSSFGLPWYLTTTVTIYNRDLLQKAGISQPPKTFEDLAQVAKQVKEKTGKKAFFVTLVPGDSGEVLESLVQMGVQLVDKEGKAAFNTPEGIAAFKYWTDLYKQGLLPAEVLTQGHRQGIELYQAGETALLSSGVQFMDAIATNAPEIAKVSAAAPQITGKTGKKNVAVMNLVVPRDSKKPEEAVKFALFVTNTQNQLAFAKAANVLPSTQAAVKTLIDELAKKSNATPMEQAIKISAEQLTDAEVLVPAMKNLNLLQKAIYENLQAAMLGEKPVEKAVADAAAEWNSAAL